MCRFRGTTAGSLTERRSVAHSPVDGQRAPGNHWPPQNSCWTSNVSSEQGDRSAAPRVHRQSIQDHRHKDGAPVSTSVSLDDLIRTAKQDPGKLDQKSTRLNSSH